MRTTLKNKPNPSLEARMKSFETYLVADRGFAASTTARYRRNFVRARLAEWKTLMPTREQVQAHKEELVLGGFDGDYARNVLMAFRNYGEWLGVDLRVKPPPKPKPRVPKFLTEQEVQAFLFVVDSIRDRAVFSFLAYSGLRCQELCNLRREDVNFEKKTVLVQQGKGGKSAEVPVAADALGALSEYLRLRKDRAPWLFPGPGGEKLSTNRVRVLARRYGRKAGISKTVSPHMFRHALATNLLAKGCPLPFVQRQLRHTRIETTLIYLHLSDQNLRDNYARFLPSYG